jgi:hypothetical protein
MSDEAEVSGARIASAARRWVTPCGVSRFLAYQPLGSDPSVELVREAVRSANRRSEKRADGVPARGDVVVAVGHEVHLRLAAGGDEATRAAWLEDVAAALPGGELTRPRSDRGPESALVELLTHRPVAAFVGQRADGDLDGLVAALLDGMEAGATAYFGAGEAGMAVDRADLAELFGTLEFAPEVTFVKDGRVCGNVATSGTAASRYLRGTTWQEELASARAALERAAPQLDVGFVRKTSAYARWGDVHLYPPVWPSEQEGLRYLLGTVWWSQRVPDAHGLQLLTADHLDRGSDLEGWEITQVGDRFLVSAPDPAPWFANDEPDQATLERARRDFGAMIATTPELTARN